MIRKLIFCLTVLLSATAVQAQNVPDYRDMVTFGQYLQQHRKTYSAYAAEKEDLLKLSDSRDPAQITAEFQGKLVAITQSYQEIYQSKVAAFNAGVGVVQGMLSSEWQELGGAVGGVLSNAFANSAQNRAEEQAAAERARLTLEFEEKFFTLKEEVLAEKRRMIDFYLMAAAFQLSEAEEKKYLDLVNYLDCECRYIEDNFSLASTSWLNSNCPRPATSRYATSTVEAKEPTAAELLATIKRKLSLPNIHFVRAARDFADIGMARFPANKEFLFYRLYLSEDTEEFNLALADELMKSPAHKAKAAALKEYAEKEYVSPVEHYDHAKKLSAGVGVAGNPISMLLKEQYVAAGCVYPVVRHGKWIYAAPDGAQAFDGEYDFGTVFKDGFAIVQKEGRWGIIDQTGNSVLHCVYFNILSQEGFHFDSFGYICVRTITRRNGIFSSDKRWVFEPERSWRFFPITLTKERFFIYNGEHWWFYDEKGNALNGNALAYFYWYIVMDHVGRYPVIDGWFKIPVKFNTYREAKKWTFMDVDGNFVWGRKVSFDEIIDDGFVDGMCLVRDRGKIFYIDKSGKPLENTDRVIPDPSTIPAQPAPPRRGNASRGGTLNMMMRGATISQTNTYPPDYGTVVESDGTQQSGYFQNGNLVWGFVADKDGKLIKYIERNDN